MASNDRAFLTRIGLSRESVRTRYFDLVFLMMVAFMWETVEHYLEV